MENNLFDVSFCDENNSRPLESVMITHLELLKEIPMTRKLLLALILLTTFICWAEKTVLGSKIHEVTVYKSQGYVKRRGSKTFAKGVHTIIVKELPVSLFQNSVQAAVLTNSAKIMGFKLNDFYNVEEVEHKDDNFYIEKIEALKKESATLLDEAGILAGSEKFLREITDNTAKRLTVENSEFSMQDLQQVMTYSEEKKREIKLKQREIKDKSDKIEKDLKSLNEKLNSLNTPPQKTKSKELTITFEVFEAQEVEFEISYTVPKVKWNPSYDIYVSEDEEQVALKFTASVYQNSGEDWDDVNLIISTNDPTVDMNIPVFSSWVVDKKKNHKKISRSNTKSSKSVKSGRSNEVVYNVEGLSVVDAEDKDYEYGKSGFSNTVMKDSYSKNKAIKTLNVEESSSAKNYKLKHKTSIVSSKDRSEVIVTTEILDIDVTHFLIPRQAKKSYLQASMTNNTEFSFLSGDAKIFFGNSYLTTVRIPQFLPTQKIDFSLGADEDVIVEFERIKKEEDDALFSSKKIMQLQYKLTVKNFRKEATEFTIIEQAPVAESKNVTVNIMEPSLMYEERSEDDERIGKIKWLVDLEPQEEKDLIIGYKIKGLK